MLGVSDESLGPLPFDRTATLLVTGPPGSGRSTTVATLVAALRRAEPRTELHYFGHPRSPLAANPSWDGAAAGADVVAQNAEALAERLRAHEGEVPPMAVVIDGISEFLSTEADMPLQELLRACRSVGVLVIAEGPTSEIGGSWPLLQAVKSARHGIILQPDQLDGEVVFKTPFPRAKRADFPVGRGLYVRQGRTVRVQVAVP